MQQPNRTGPPAGPQASPWAPHHGPVRPFLIPRNRFSRPDGKRTTVERIRGTWPSVVVTPQAHGKMWALVRACPIEIGWLSPCTRRADGAIIVSDVFVPSQVCTASTTEITPDGEQEMLSAFIAEGKLHTINSLRCWGHSHVSMSVFASGTDEQQTRVYLDRFDDFFVRLIANKRGDLFCSLYLIEEGFAIHDPVLELYKNDWKAYAAWAEREVKTKVSEPPRRFFYFGPGRDRDGAPYGGWPWSLEPDHRVDPGAARGALEHDTSEDTR